MNDPLGPIKGLMLATLLSLVFWSVMVALLVRVFDEPCHVYEGNQCLRGQEEREAYSERVDNLIQNQP